MESGIFSKQGKKLLLIAAVLLVVVSLIGGEGDPGVLTKISEQPNVAGNTHLPDLPDQGGAQPVTPPAYDKAPPSNETPELDTWYAQAGSTGPVDPTPETDDFLVNDTMPLVSTEPTR